MKKIILTICAIFCLITIANASPLTLNPNHPNRYVVKQGDTLWDISARFLKNPWEWTRLWRANSHIKDPDAIYPGDVLALSIKNGQPILQRISRGPVTKVIATIPYEDIAPFLMGVQVVTPIELENAAYIVAIEEDRAAAGEGMHVFARRMHWGLYPNYSIFSLGDPLVDPETGKELGVSTIDTGVGHLISEGGEPAALVLTKSFREVEPKNHLLPLPPKMSASDFSLHPPICMINGEVISLLDDACAASQHQIVIINRGSLDRVRRGDVLTIYKRGEVIADPMTMNPDSYFHYSGRHHADIVKLPDERNGAVVIFRVFPDVSYGLVMSARREIERGDRVLTPS